MAASPARNENGCLAAVVLMGNTTCYACCRNSCLCIWHLSNNILIGAYAPGGQIDMEDRQLSQPQ
jgi:hypothetical protein